MGRVFENIVDFLTKHFFVYLAILLASITLFFFGFLNLNLDENIYSIFPQGEEFEKFNSVLKENNLNKQIVFSIDAEGKSVDDLYVELDSVSRQIEKETTGLITDYEVFRESQEEAILDYHYNNFPVFLNENDYSEIESKLLTDSIRESIGRVNDRLTSINAFFFRKVLAKDPLGIAWKKLGDLNPRSDSTAMSVEDGILFSADGKRALFTAVLDFELDDNVKNEELNLKLLDLRKEINASTSKIDFDYFGTFQISYENSRQVKEDTFVTLIVSVGLILLLLIVYYRSILTPLYFVLPALFAGFSGLGLVGYLHPNISAISIATAAVLMGIVLDYSFHFFTHLKHSGDLRKSVRELSFPMLVGSFTTVAAFSALIFTDSVVLQNFGLIALCTLISAVIFTLLLLPPLLHFTHYKIKSSKKLKDSSKVSKWTFRISMYGILVLTVVFLLRSNQFKFDSDLNNLSYHTEELIEKEEYFTGINPEEEKKLHLFVSAENREELAERNFELYESLTAFRREYGLDELISAAPYDIPSRLNGERTEAWGGFWENRIDSTMRCIEETAELYDFSSQAFSSFENWVSEPRDFNVSSSELLDDLGLSRFLYSTEEGWSAITSVVVNRSDLNNLKSQINEVAGVYIFDVSEMANTLMLSVQDDFNYLLLFSSLLVFFSLLVVYGRFELALFAFLPMVISWIWILGIAGFFDIQFNFVNIIVATFIFGLGDDFSIFVTDGLQQKYKLNVDSLNSYKSAIILSGITTIIGTGALYFAKHPAIHSIAIISVVGIGCIMLVTLVIQPSLYRFFITNRTEHRKSPITLLGLLYSVFLFSYFFIGCLVLNILLLPLILLPVKKSFKRKVLNFTISKLAGSTIYLGFHVKKQIIHPERLDFSRPSIIVANHSSFLDILLMIMMNPKVIIMVKKWVYYSPVFGFFIRYSGYLFIAEGTEYNLDLIRSRVDEGYSVMIFPEGTRSRDGKIKRFHKGAFYLAQELELEVQPILIVGAHYVNSKNDLIIKSGSLILVVLERIKTTDSIYQQRFGVFAKETQKLMREAMKDAKREIEDASYLKNRVLYNYLYKGPIMEWYVRIKWRFEQNNFSHYDSLIEDRKRIYDIGCGLGYLSYFLHYRNEEREIVGIDYDDEKIQVAQNGYDKDDNLQFVQGDIRDLRIEAADVVFYNDVLHYMGQEKQLEVLNKTIDNLNDNGILIIRDGITDLADRHSVTKRTEKYSTQIVNFNKITEQLFFFSSKDIFNLAKERNLRCDMIEQSEKTSNVLFVLRK